MITLSLANHDDMLTRRLDREETSSEEDSD